MTDENTLSRLEADGLVVRKRVEDETYDDEPEVSEDHVEAPPVMGVAPEIRDLIASAMPGTSFHDKDVTGESWAWTSPKGKFRLLLSHLPQRAVVLEFKYTKQRQDRVQMVVSVVDPSVKDIEDYILSPLLHVLDMSASLY